jgi:hypothetical protein
LLAAVAEADQVRAGAGVPVTWLADIRCRFLRGIERGRIDGEVGARQVRAIR